MTNGEQAPHIPDIILERYRLRELPADELARLDALIRQDGALRLRLEDMAASDEVIRRQGLPRVEPSPARGRARMLWLVPAALAAAAVLAIVVAPLAPLSSLSSLSGPSKQPGTTDRVDRIKGLRPALALYRHTPEGSETLADGAVVHRGDLVRVGYRAAGHSYGVIFSIDGRDAVTMHLPPAGDRAAPLGRGSPVLLDQSYELDDAPVSERFYFVAGDAPFVVSQVVDVVRRAGALPKGLEQATFVLQKEARP